MNDNDFYQDWLDDNEEPETEGEEERPSGKTRTAFHVLYQDDDLLALDKAPGVPTIPERGSEESLKTLAQQQFGRLWTVHRIDKQTSGVVLFARTPEAHRDLNEQFRTRETEKRYLAVLEGEMPQEEMTIDIPLAPDPGKAGRIRPSASGKEALTVLRVRERFRGYTLAEAQPLTGRQHQIRVHCRAVGLPLLVDFLYGGRDAFFLSSIKRKYKDYGREERPLIGRLTLHAESLTVRHPGTGEPITFTAELPKDMRALLTQLRKLKPGS